MSADNTVKERVAEACAQGGHQIIVSAGECACGIKKAQFKPDYADKHFRLTREQAHTVYDLLSIAHEAEGHGKPAGLFLQQLAEMIDKAAHVDIEAGESNLLVIEVVEAT